MRAHTLTMRMVRFHSYIIYLNYNYYIFIEPNHIEPVFLKINKNLTRLNVNEPK